MHADYSADIGLLVVCTDKRLWLYETSLEKEDGLYLGHADIPEGVVASRILSETEVLISFEEGPSWIQSFEDRR